MKVLASALLVLVVASAAVTAQLPPPYGRSAPNTLVPPTQQPTEEQRSNAPQQTGTVGAMPQATQAEKVRKSEEALQGQLAEIGQALDNLEKRATEMRRRTEAPPRWDVDRMDQDINLLTQQVAKISSTGLSPLAELQHSDLRDRLFELQLSMEIAKRRWGGTWSVFGMDFFANAPPVPTVEQRPAPANYKLRIGDKLRVTVSSRLGQENEYHPAVDTSGNIHVPGAGVVPAMQKTCEQLRQSLAAKIGARFKQLRVDVALESMATLLVQVAGDVAHPGACTLTGMPTVLSALYQAGGPTKSGTFRRIELTREGEPKHIIDLYDFLMRGSRDQDLPLKDGDLVFVPPVGHTITVEGDVVRPARYEPDFPIALGEALKMAGGVRATGLHTVQVERVENNQYRVLLNEPIAAGDGRSSFVLKPGDSITVTSVRPDRTNQVSVEGPVRAPGLYGLAERMRVADLVKLAQGLDPNEEVYGGRADVLRTDPLSGTEILTLSLDRALAGDPRHNLELHKLDRLFIYKPDQVIFRPRLVSILGAVAKPGTYKRAEGMRVSDAVAAAGGVLPEAYLDRADVIRRAADGSSELVRVSLQEAMSGDALANLKLQNRDELTVYDYADVHWSDRTVRIEGAVQRPGVYARSKNMRVSDLVFYAAGGLLPEAAKMAEVGRCAEGGKSALTRVDLSNLVPASAGDILLKDRDVVTVPAVNPSLRSPEIVFINGEVARPGPYTLASRDETLGDIIRRAGGLTPFADPRGMLFLRQKESFENSQQDRDADLILRKSRAFADRQFLTHLAKLGISLPGEFIKAVQESAEKLAKPSEVVPEEKLEKDVTLFGAGGPTAPATVEKPYGPEAAIEMPNAPEAMGEAAKPEEPEKTSAMGPRIAEPEDNQLSGFEGRQELAILANSSRVSVDLNRALQDPNSPDDIPMRQGDHVFIPRVTNIVKVIGAVLHPHDFAAGTGESVDYYIGRSGGFAQDAAKGNVVVVRSNGDALPKDRVRTVEAGDMIVVPTTGLIDIAKKWERIGSVTKVLSDVLSSVFILTRF